MSKKKEYFHILLYLKLHSVNEMTYLHSNAVYRHHNISIIEVIFSAFLDCSCHFPMPLN